MSALLLAPVMLRGEVVRIPHVPQDRLRAGIRPELRQYLDDHPVVGIVAAPVRVRGGLRGMVMFTRDTPARPYTEEDERFVVHFAERVSTLILAAEEIDAAWTARERLARRFRTWLTGQPLDAEFDPATVAELLEGDADRNVAVVVYDVDGRIIGASTSVEKTAGYDTGTLVGRTFVDVVDPSDIDDRAENFARLASGELDYHDFHANRAAVRRHDARLRDAPRRGPPPRLDPGLHHLRRAPGPSDETDQGPHRCRLTVTGPDPSGTASVGGVEPQRRRPGTPSMNLKEAARRLGVHYQTAYRWVRSGDLVAVRIGSRYEVSDAAIERLRAQRRALGTPSFDARPHRGDDLESELTKMADGPMLDVGQAVVHLSRRIAETTGDLCVVAVLNEGRDHVEAASCFEPDSQRLPILAGAIAATDAHAGPGRRARHADGVRRQPALRPARAPGAVPRPGSRASSTSSSTTCASSG